MGLVTTFCPLMTTGTGDLVLQTAGGLTLVLDCKVNPAGKGKSDFSGQKSDPLLRRAAARLAVCMLRCNRPTCSRGARVLGACELAKRLGVRQSSAALEDRKSTRLNSSHVALSRMPS